MHPWRGRSRPSQQDLPIRDPDTVLGDRHPQMIACEAFLGRPVRRFIGVRPESESPVVNPWALAWLKHCATIPQIGERLARGKSYLDNGLVWHLEIDRGEARAIVLGSQLYAQRLTLSPLSRADEAHLIEVCSGQVHRTERLVSGHLPSNVFAQLTDPSSGLFPRPDQIKFSCSCDEEAPCKHSIAALIAIAHRLNEQPGNLFLLRGTEPEILKGLLPAGLSRPAPEEKNLIAFEQVEDVFDLRLDRQEYEDEVAATKDSEEDPLGSFLGDKEAEPSTEQPPPVQAKEPVVARSRRDSGSWLDDDWDEDEDEADIDAEVFGGSGPSPVSVTTSGEGEDVLEIGRADLLELGLPSHRIQRWLSDGTLLRTNKRGQYQLTPDAWIAIEPLLPSD